MHQGMECSLKKYEVTFVSTSTRLTGHKPRPLTDTVSQTPAGMRVKLILRPLPSSNGGNGYTLLIHLSLNAWVPPPSLVELFCQPALEKKGSRSKEASGGDQGAPGGCKNPVCYEAHLELVGALLGRGQFER